MEVSEEEVEAYAEVVEDTGGYVPVDTGPLAEDPGAIPDAAAQPGLAAAPPPLPRRRAWRPRPALVIGVAVLCTAAGLAGGLLWNVLSEAGEDQAAESDGATAADQGVAEEVQIRLDEMVVTSGDSEEAKPPEEAKAPPDDSDE